MDNQEVARILFDIAEMLEVEDVQFKPRAYRKAANSIRNLNENINVINERNELEEIDGIGKSIAEKVKKLLETGKLDYYEEMKKKYPVDFVELENISGLGAKRIVKLNKELGIRNAKDLKDAAKAGKIRQLDGFGQKTEQEILDNIKRNKNTRFLIDQASETAKEVINLLKDKEIIKIEIAGSLRRGKETIGDIDLICVSKNSKKTLDNFSKLKIVKKVVVKGPSKCSVILYNDMQVDLRIWPDEQYGSAMCYFTGSKSHNIELRQIALKKNMKLSEYGLFKGKKVIANRTENDIYAALGLKYITPELREERGEIEAAKKDMLPALIVSKDIKGDCQMHSTYSDGIDSIKNLADKAEELGYEYIVVTDHGGNLKIAGAMDLKDITERNKEIAKLNQDSKVKIVSGIEANIGLDGKLDVPKNHLKKVDFVLAAIHSGFKRDMKTQTDRLLKAMDNEHVNCIAHPSGRILNGRIGYDLDWDKVLNKCKVKNIAVEINANPKRLDVSDEIAKLAVKKGVKIMINTDAHSTDEMENMKFGVMQARRGWCKKLDVLNCLGRDEFIKKLK